MPSSLTRILSALSLTLILFGSASAQVEWPVPPANWWTQLDGGDLPTATYDVSMGMAMTLSQSVQAIDGSRITVATSVNMMGNAMPAQSQVIDATTLTPEGGLAMMQGALSGDANQQQQTMEDLNAAIEVIENTTCSVGDLELECTEYVMTMEGMTSRVWHAPAIPPIFLGGIVRSESTVAGQSFTTSLSSYTGTLLN